MFSSLTGYSTDIIEGTAGVGPVTALDLVASDLDCGDTAALLYTLVSGDTSPPSFAMNASTGLLSVATALDREVAPTFRLTVSVSDQHNPPRVTSAEIAITVLDINDNTPTFAQAAYAFATDESQSCGNDTLTVCQQLGVVLARDVDLGLSGDVVYSVMTTVPPTAAGVFGVDPTTGAISLNRDVCHFSSPAVMLTVNATDQGSPPLSSTVNVNITINSVNAVAPVFVHTGVLSVSISEQNDIVSIANVTAFNADCIGASSLRYSISTVGSPFGIERTLAINTLTGEIKTTAPIDREVQSFLSLVVVVVDNQDGVVRSASTQVQVQILDVNDNAPVFDALSYVFPDALVFPCYLQTCLLSNTATVLPRTPKTDVGSLVIHLLL